MSRSVQQLRLKLRRPASFARDDFIFSETNADAIRALDAWPAWHGGCLALIGPEGGGKTHLAMGWAERTGALVLEPGGADLTAVRGRPVLVEDASAADGDLLFHLINMAGAGGGLLLTDRGHPRTWPATLPDLRSRLNALPTAEIGEPDDAVLEGVLRKFFRDRHIRPAEDVYPYLMRRIERSVRMARDIVKRLDDAADAEQREITRALARQILESEEETLNLFEQRP
ncbi:MAG: chromosomal replication initiator DnaA [Caulobacteraceae bacterium]|nr:chromosomal replication initiator DnaA [Caulobacteraceae bacterium]